jgi:hypothetical protein
MARAQIHTIDQPETDTTAFFLSCDRLDLLAVTFSSFISTSLDTVRMVILDDSGNPDVFSQLVSQYGQQADIICLPENRGPWHCMDFMVSWCFTKYIMYIEDDWKFLDSGYLQQSRRILETHRDIGIVDISDRRFEAYGACGKEEPDFIRKNPFRLSPTHLYWVGWCGSPNLKRREDLVRLGRIEAGYAEWQIDRKFYLLGLKAVWLKKKYVTHLGDDNSKLAGKRADDSKTPCMQCPLQPNCRLPRIDWYFLEQQHKQQQLPVNADLYGPRA